MDNSLEFTPADIMKLHAKLKKFVERIHAYIVLRTWVRLMPREDIVEVIWSYYFVGFQWMSLTLLCFQAL